MAEQDNQNGTPGSSGGAAASSGAEDASAPEDEERTVAPEQNAFLKPGQVVNGQFEIIRALGRGGMGIVYEARDRFLGERVALKTILPEHLSKPRAVKRFIEEINVARSLQHPSIVPVYDVARDGQILFFTMEFLKGVSLRTLLQERGHFDLEETVRILGELADALIYAHEFLVHRDLSPDNVMVLPDGSIKLLDFGLARMQARGTMTATGAALGKAYYMAPEQAKDAAHVDARADIFSLGVMVFEMLSGELPVGFQRLSDVKPGLPPACDALIGRCLAPVDRRIASAAEFKAALEQCLESGAPSENLELVQDKAQAVPEPIRPAFGREPVLRAGPASPPVSLGQTAAEGLRSFADEMRKSTAPLSEEKPPQADIAEPKQRKKRKSWLVRLVLAGAVIGLLGGLAYPLIRGTAMGLQLRSMMQSVTPFFDSVWVSITPRRFSWGTAGIITDAETGLEWCVGAEMDWNTALKWTQGLSLGGGGWGLPTLAELQRLRQAGTGLDPAFGSDTDRVWSCESDEKGSWYFDCDTNRTGQAPLAQEHSYGSSRYSRYSRYSGDREYRALAVRLPKARQSSPS